MCEIIFKVSGTFVFMYKEWIGRNKNKMKIENKRSINLLTTQKKIIIEPFSQTWMG